jgi:double-strand break repair protein MRE11
VATSLSEGESKKKHIGLLEIYEDQFRLQAIELKTVRPFVMEEVVLKEADLDPGEPQHVIEYLAEKVEELIAKADKQSPHAPRTPTKPLIRLKVRARLPGLFRAPRRLLNVMDRLSTRDTRRSTRNDLASDSLVGWRTPTRSSCSTRSEG